MFLGAHLCLAVLLVVALHKLLLLFLLLLLLLLRLQHLSRCKTRLSKAGNVGIAEPFPSGSTSCYPKAQAFDENSIGCGTHLA